MTLNFKKTHSERLMPLIDSLYKASGINVKETEAVAAASGPGSFTGLRIGVSTARALAQALKIPAVGVSTLSALAEAVSAPGCLICPVLDARRDQVYTALYLRTTSDPLTLETLLAPRAIALADLLNMIEKGEFLPEVNSSRLISLTGSQANQALFKTAPVIFTGEGLNSYKEEISKTLPGRAVITTAVQSTCRAALVALKGRRLLEKNPHSSCLELLPLYLRRPEAERNRIKKKEAYSPDHGF